MSQISTVSEHDSIGDAAPLSRRVRNPMSEFALPTKTCRRNRKRGPRSYLAGLRRQCKFRCAPPGVMSGPAGICASGSGNDMPHGSKTKIDFHKQQGNICTLLSVNLRSLLRNEVELAYCLENSINLIF